MAVKSGVVMLSLFLSVIIIYTASCQSTVDGESCSPTDGGDLQSLREQLARFQHDVWHQLQRIETVVQQRSNQPSVGQSEHSQIKALRENCIPLLIQQSTNNGSILFNRSWAEYKAGFNDSKGNYWLGNEMIHQLTVNGNFKLRIDLQSQENSSLWFWAEYSSFFVLGEEANYRLQISGFTGNTGFDALAFHNGMMFTTYDSDNDRFSGGNCATQVNRGGFWYNFCDNFGPTSRNQGFEWLNLPGGKNLKTSRMWLMCP